MPVIVVEPASDRRLAVTVEQAAARYNLKLNSMSGELTRLGKHKDEAVRRKLAEITVHVDGKKRAYIAVELDKLMKTARPGRGANLRRQPADT